MTEQPLQLGMLERIQPTDQICNLTNPKSLRLLGNRSEDGFEKLPVANRVTLTGVKGVNQLRRRSKSLNTLSRGISTRNDRYRLNTNKEGACNHKPGQGSEQQSPLHGHGNTPVVSTTLQETVPSLVATIERSLQKVVTEPNEEFCFPQIDMSTNFWVTLA